MASAFGREGGYGGEVSVINNDSPGADHVIIPDAQLLFTAAFRRVGPDLVLTGDDDRRYVIPGYFANENRPNLVASNGATLSSDLVNQRAGSSSAHAQAQPTTPPDPIGKVESVEGNVTVVRNGVAVELNVGDVIFKSDVIETGIDGLVALVFADGTRFHLYASTHMVLDEFNCGVEKSSNSALFRVVKGVFGFIAGKVAATGRLVVDTPLGQIQSAAPAAGFGTLAFSIFTFSLIKELKAAPNDIALLDDGTIDYKDLKHGVYEIVTKEAHPRRIIVDDPGETLVLRLSGSGTISIEQVANTPIVMAQNEIAYRVNHDYFLRAQQDPFIQHFLQEHANAQPTNNNANAGTNTGTNTASTGSTGSSTPNSVLLPTTTAQLIQPVQNNTATPSTASVPTAAPEIISLNTTPATPHPARDSAARAHRRGQ